MDRPNLDIRDGGAGADFTNPVIFADVPDPDVVFDGRYYYMVSTTMSFPGVPIMCSSDLVHWSIAGYTRGDPRRRGRAGAAQRPGRVRPGQLGSEHQVP